MKSGKEILPGIVLALFVSFFCQYMSKFEITQWIGPGIMSLFMGATISQLFVNKKLFIKGSKFVQKHFLKISIILMGGTFQIKQVYEVGRASVLVIIGTLLISFLGGSVLRKILKMDWKMSSLISAGVGVCGGSAIAALAPTIEADPEQISYSMTIILIFDLILIVLFPFIGHILNLSDLSFGLWVGTAINDTSSVVAAGYSYSKYAGDFAMIVKLTRTLSIIPIVIIFGYIYQKNNKNDVEVRKVFPWFILYFLLMVFARSGGLIPNEASQFFQSLSKFLMVVALFSVGFNTDLKSFKKLGYLPILYGVTISVLIVIVSLSIQVFL